jgi:hypothetical protein
MTMIPSLGIPELAGLATYAEAARIGYSVEENVGRLLRYQWTERRVMVALLSHLPAEPVWEVKCAMALHQWQDAQHVDALRRRVSEMRHPVPPLDSAPDDRLELLLDEMLRSGDTVELLAGTYDVVRRALVEAYQRHLRETNPLVDQPTRRVLRLAMLDHEEALQWSRVALEALTRRDAAAAVRAEAWRRHRRRTSRPRAAWPAPPWKEKAPRSHRSGPASGSCLISAPGGTTASPAGTISSSPRTWSTTIRKCPRTSATWRCSASGRSKWTCPR